MCFVTVNLLKCKRLQNNSVIINLQKNLTIGFRVLGDFKKSS